MKLEKGKKLKMELILEIKSIGFEIILLVGAVFFLLSFLAGRNTRHKRNIRKADRYLKKVSTFESNRAVFGYLRKVDPFVFEEMILSALKENGHSIQRNRRYVADGGIDGRVTIGGVKYLIQAKRYSSHINVQHVKDFINLCERQGKKGLFVHTGKTGKTSWATGLSSGTLDIISGDRLLDLLIRKRFSVRI